MAARGARRRRRRRRRGDGTLFRLLIPVSLLVIVGIVAVLVLHSPASAPQATPSAAACPAAEGVIVGDINVPAGPIDGYCQVALINAAQIIRASVDVTGGDIRATEIGVMTAIGESNLQNLSYGDSAGPDSRGLFQQRSNYGSIADRMDPYTAASAFFHRMLGVANWSTRPPTEVAHAVQINADPNYYTPYFPRAVDLVTALLADRVPPSFQLTPAVTPAVPPLPSPTF